ncbi:MAG: hypothetical protein PHH84_01930, partial [Oscillospiraceae bacterium]|nr:hypothetical protein [Oscillospiraceae bacterium]
MFSLNGKDWRLTGWARHQWSMEKLVETSDSSQPCVQTVPATVPGGVHCDLLRAGIISDWNDDTNFRHLEWVEHREWTLEKNFSLPRGDFDRIRLRFEGLDYSGFVFVNGHEVMRFQGMHIPYEADITAVTLPGANRLCIVFEQPPEVDGQVGYTSKTTVLKSRYNYGWDWMPRMVNIGIFGDVGLLCDRKACLKEVYPSTQTDGRSGQLTLNAEIEFLTNSPVTFQADLYEGDRLVAVCTESVCASDSTTAVCLKMELPSVRLWEVNGRGGQPLYRAEVRLKDADGRLLDQCVKTVGFRILEFRRPEGAPP